VAAPLPDRQQLEKRLADTISLKYKRRPATAAIAIAPVRSPPTAFIIEGDPFLLLWRMIYLLTSGLPVGATRAFVYLRSDIPTPRESLQLRDYDAVGSGSSRPQRDRGVQLRLECGVARCSYVWRRGYRSLGEASRECARSRGPARVGPGAQCAFSQPDGGQHVPVVRRRAGLRAECASLRDYTAWAARAERFDPESSPDRSNIRYSAGLFETDFGLNLARSSTDVAAWYGAPAGAGEGGCRSGARLGAISLPLALFFDDRVRLRGVFTAKEAGRSRAYSSFDRRRTWPARLASR